MADPVSWKVMEPGWRVFDAEGNEVGKVGEITGDTEEDIFDGLTLAGAHGHTRYVPAESVAEIRDREVHLSLTREGVDALESSPSPRPSCRSSRTRCTGTSASRGGPPAATGERRARVRACARARGAHPSA